MAEQAVTLGEIIRLEIPVDGKWTCLAETLKQERCQRPVAKPKRNAARKILQHNMTFQESEHDLIRSRIKELVDLLFHKDNNHPDIERQMSEQETEWLDLWRTELAHRTRLRCQSYDSAIALQDPEQSPSGLVAITADHEPYDIAPIPAPIPAPTAAVVRYPTLPVEPTPVPTNALVSTTAMAPYLNRTSTLVTMEDISDQAAEAATASLPSVVGYDAPLAPNQTSPHENLGLSVFFSPNQLEMINIILQVGLQLCAFFQIQYGNFISHDRAGNKRTESFLRFKLMFAVDFTLSEILTSPWVMFPLAAALGQLMYILIGPWLALMLFLFVALVGSCWTGTTEKAIVRRAERV